MRTLKYLLLVIAAVKIVEYSSSHPEANINAIASIAIGCLSAVFVLMFCVIRGPAGRMGPPGAVGPKGDIGRCKCNHSISSSDTGGYGR